jgi:hypothetical protein
MDFIYDKSKVTWKYKDKQYEYSTENILNAYMEKEYIFITTYENIDDNHHSEGHIYVTLKGVLIASVVTNLNNYSMSVKILDEDNKESNLDIPKLYSLAANDKYIYAIVGDENKKIVKYSLQGEILKEYPEPRDYSIYRFFNLINDEKKIEFVIYDSKNISWKFSLNAETGEWTKMYYIRD